jgi:glyoxylase-like metal-dependent hydrolase (beta-lactamase superfamily II)
MPHTNEVTLLQNEGWDERLLVCANGRLVQTFIIVTRRYLVLLDTLINATTARAMLDYATEHLAGRQLLVINSHADYDHCWGNQLFAGPQAEYDAPIIATEGCRERLRDPEAARYLHEMQTAEPEIFNEVVLTPPTFTFNGRLTIDGGDLTLQLIPTPGHTPDQIAVYIPEISTLLATDGAELPYPLARTPEALPQMRASLQQMADLDAQTVLYCHAPVTIGPQLLHDNIAYFDGIEAACSQAIEKGLSTIPEDDEAVLANVDLAYETAVPHHGPWQEVHTYYRTTGHAQQIRAMLQILLNRET